MIAPFQLLLPGRILFGRGEAARAAPLTLAFGPRVLLIHGRDGARAEWLLRDLSQGGQVLALPCAREPDLPMLEAVLGMARDFAPDVVVGLGGGAVLDLAKALAALIPADTPVLDHLEGVGQGLPLQGAPLPFIALPTTAGTGAEATKNAVIGVPAIARKVSLRDDRMMARLAIVDPALTDGCPRGVTLASGLDAITQLIEPYVSLRANPATDALARQAIPLGLASLKRLMEAEDQGARDQMAWASLAGGIALANAALGAVHGLAGVIGGLTGAAHGAICGALLPFVITANRAHAPSGPTADRLAEVEGWLTAAFGPGGATALHCWAQDNGLPGLAALGLSPADHPRVVAAARGASSMKGNPVVLDDAVLLGILRDAG